MVSNLEKPESDVSPEPDINQESNEEVEEEKLLAYRDFIFKALAYEWLLASSRRDSFWSLQSQILWKLLGRRLFIPYHHIIRLAERSL